MSLPLYAQARDDLSKLEKRPDWANVGLWYNKMCNRWQIDKEQWTLDKTKEKWISSVTGKKCGEESILHEAISRYSTLVRSCGGEVRVYRTASRFVTGLGNEHPVENGFTWHHTLGTPYLPGSSVKGVLRAWVQHWLDMPLSEVNRLFGPEKDKSETAAGGLIVFDALPVRLVQLEIEIMTPHYAEYYQDTGTGKPPADWYSPVPIPYLTVVKDQLFVFGLAPRKESAIDLQQVFSWMDQALATIGAGAKTASGYGCFQPEKNYNIPVLELKQRSEALKTAAAAQPMSPIRQEMDQDGYTDPNVDIFMKAMTVKWLDRMENNDTSGDDRREIARLLAEWYQKNKSKDWEKPTNSKNQAKVERIKVVLNSH
ncbi:type III-B CRISPR module RAMP protein Cmr6 [Pelotomaculum terephthalicicum JT]|uniref:type III-B CRISPR module RAMP protein Cmr6 n=1 Tax=Pelotomaculum TaxID=191373 RepID=UPI0009CABAA5|nr:MULTISPECIES: type III-B CRISPR module RAMP protein Cmr6 [Pelotomaculum]MCG9968431.1 type III-B CRISPR module RAMP protein Cmr6 [Pelotomaculum terephthalicicum JT]OPX87183.1 MAG: hypothetical protein A4E54_01782 [Pelotomaculum sp. PtaB.Bin117]OPY60877.1 MAG: hypothetical protein A4E56_02414 [Pelotomaculum sp. PtaU1.Bin065]